VIHGKLPEMTELMTALNFEDLKVEAERERLALETMEDQGLLEDP
jgi:hypothetical protein